MRVVIADDSVLLREGLARLLAESGIEVCATVAGRDDAGCRRRDSSPGRGHRRHPDAAQLHARGCGRCGRAACRAIPTSASCCSPRPSRRTSPPNSSSGTLPTSATCSRTGSSTWLVLTQALESVAAGGTVLDPDIVHSLMRAHARRSPVLALSERERDVLALMAEGMSNAAIADRLVVSGKTVESHIANIFSKLGLHDEPGGHRRVLAVLAALRHGSSDPAAEA